MIKLFYLIVLLSCSSIVKNKTLKLSQVQLSYRDYGFGDKTLILIHGGPGTPGYMKSLGDKLAKDFRIIEYFQRDHTNSPSKGPFQINNSTKDLHELLKHLKLKKKNVILLAHSWGALLALQYLSEYPKSSVQKAILLSPGPLQYQDYQFFYKNVLNKTPTKEKDKVLKLISYWQQQGNRSAQEEYEKHQEWFKLILPSYFYSKKRGLDKKILSLIKTSPKNWPSTKAVVRSFYSQENQRYLGKKLSGIKAPLSLIIGKNDVFPVKLTANKVKSYQKHLKLYQLERSGHCLWLDDNKDLFFDILREELGN